MTGYVYFVFISSEFFYILESPSNGLCGIFRVGRILGTRAESVVYGYHGVALLQELLRKMFFSGFQSSAVEPDKGGKSFFISRIMEVELANDGNACDYLFHDKLLRLCINETMQR